MGKDKIMEHNKRVEQIKTYLERLSAGEELEKVRADFAKEFKAVDPAEIMQAEQELLQGGTPRRNSVMTMQRCSAAQRVRIKLPTRKKRLRHR